MPIEDHGSALPIGTVLNEYKIESILGVGGFGITYIAIDINLNKKVVIKEYLPNDIAIRQESSKVIPKSNSDRDNFEWGLERFLQEAQTLAKFNHPNIVKINRFFRANNSAYFVMDYEKGIDLDEYLKAYNGRVDEAEIYNIIMPILDGLREVHLVDYLHRDIKPANIYMRDNGSPMLIDFGASRLAMGAKSKSLSVVLTEGYAPKEQYSTTSKQGAYTDLYAVGAVMYKMVTGDIPTESSARVDLTSDGEQDPYKRLQDQKSLPYNDNFKIAVDWALSLRSKDRPQSAKEFQDALMSTSSPKDKERNKEKDIDPPKKATKMDKEPDEKSNSGMIAIIVLLIVIIIGGGVWQVNTNTPIPIITDNSKEIEVQKAREIEQNKIEDKAEADRQIKEAEDRLKEINRKIREEDVKRAIDEADRIARAQRLSENTTKYKVTNVASWDTLNVRSNPYVKNNKVGELQANSKNIEVIYCQNNHNGVKWCKINPNNSRVPIGWVVARCIVSQNHTYTSSNSSYRVVNIRSDDTLSVRNGAGTEYSKVGDLAYNAIGISLGRCKHSTSGGRWCHIKLGSLSGWTSAKYLRN